MACDDDFSYYRYDVGLHEAMISLGVGKLKDEVVYTLAWRLTEVAAMADVESTLEMRSGQTVMIVGQQQQLLHLSKQTLRGNDARTFELVQGIITGVGTGNKAKGRPRKWSWNCQTYGSRSSRVIILNMVFTRQLFKGSARSKFRFGVEGVILCLYVLSLRCLLVKGAYGCILGTLFCSVQMVNTRQSTPEFSGPAFDEEVQRAVNALLPYLTTQITNELRQNGAGSSGEQPPTIHTWLEWFGKQKP
ncbi:hypothetical protein Tco_1031203 [Tanacetum coccineum]|uniref:Uncharacterized protein n=1 Tax=Tanacetum coccineum TaxID=301880 RepID=A0ABQ5GAK8_9ASTR